MSKMIQWCFCFALENFCDFNGVVVVRRDARKIFRCGGWVLNLYCAIFETRLGTFEIVIVEEEP